VNMQIILSLIFSMILMACTTPASHQKDLSRICDSSGCSDRSGNYISNHSSAASSDEEARIRVLEDVARQDPRAAYDLGLRYFRGDGVRQDSYQALQWMREAAEKGDLNAQKALGRLYLTGLEEMGADYREAEKWLRIAAGRGDKESEQLLVEAAAFASEERRSGEIYHRWVNRWKPVFYQNWYHGYPYLGTWRGNYWYY